MDEVGLILLGIFVVLAFPVIAIIALVVALNARADARSLRERLDALDMSAGPRRRCRTGGGLCSAAARRRSAAGSRHRRRHLLPGRSRSR